MPTTQDYHTFLDQVIPLCTDNDMAAMKQVVYPLLQAHLDYLTADLIPVLRSWATEKFSKADELTKAEVPSNIVKFSVLLYDFPLGDKAAHIEIAMAGYETAAPVLTREAFPNHWAMIQNLLGLAYEYRQHGDTADNLEQAINCYQQALQVYTHEAFPNDWAMTQNNLGIAYRNRQHGEPADNLERAIHCFQQALQVYTREAFPQDYFETKDNLGFVYQARKQWQPAYTCFAEAIETMESLRKQIKSDDARRNFAARWEKLYDRIINVCLQSNREAQAIEYVERSKACNVTFLSAQQDSPALPAFRFQHLDNLLEENMAIVEWYINMQSNKLQIFILRRGRKIAVIELPKGSTLDLITAGNDYLKTYQRNRQAWPENVQSCLEGLAQLLSLDAIVAELQQTPRCTQLILIPHCFMHLFPLHALLLADQQCLLDKFTSVHYAPSCQLLHLVHARPRPHFDHLLAIQNPTQDLLYTDLEVASIRQQFQPHDEVLHQAAARKTALDPDHLRHIHCLHFSCHGYFDLHSFNSALLLADAKFTDTPAPAQSYLRTAPNEWLDLTHCLTLTEIWQLPLHECRLVTLSACETGLTNPTSSTDEYIGLPAGFLYAGANHVVSSLWLVDELATTLLMIKFYDHYRHTQTSVAHSLNEAQRWLRALTTAELQKLLQEGKLPFNTLNQQTAFTDKLQRHPNDKPFASPYYWGAFCAIGK
jgi:CHAT domain-containing protein